MAQRRALQDQYRILRARRRAYVAERERARQAGENDRFADMIRCIRGIDGEIQEVLKAL